MLTIDDFCYESQLKGPSALPAVMALFEKRFSDKTGHPWAGAATAASGYPQAANDVSPKGPKYVTYSL